MPKVPTLPKLPGLPTLPRPPWEPPPPSVPGIAGGVVTSTNIGWNLVEFSDIVTGAKVRFSAKPAVVALAEVRFGDILPVTAPSITVPSITLPNIAIPRASQIIRIARPDFNSGYYCDLVASKARDGAKKITPPWPLDIIWGWFCDTLVYLVFYAAMFGIGFIFNVVWDSFIQPQVNKVEDDIDAVLGDFRNKAQAAINSFGAGLQNNINWFRDELTARINQGLSTVIPKLYDTIHLPQGQLVTPVNTQNVTETSFEYYALSEGQLTHYIALGVP